MQTPALARVGTVVLAVALVALSCDGSTEPGPPAPREAQRGIVRQQVTSMPFDHSLDPTSEYTSMGFALFSNLLSRPLMNYRHVAGAAGNEALPDLADGMPRVSDDRLTYEFTLKQGVRFGPPLDREVTSRDVAFAFERLATPELEAGYEFYFTSAIEGLSEYAAGEADEITGIQTPDDRTIVFHLIQPTGDFLKRLAMPAVAPIPEEIAGCFSKPGEYGRHLVATGPYMIRGSGSIGTSCGDLEPAKGFRPEKRLTLVPNPNYDPATDDPAIRSARFLRYEMTVEEDSEEIYRGIADGHVDVASGNPGLDVIRRYTSRRRLRDNMHVEAGDRMWYISMNLTEPPFDDVHVRRAANLVMDKDFLVRAWGGRLLGNVATHILPNGMLQGALESFDPYRSPHDAGDASGARREMQKSRYDRNADGMCDVPACRGVLHITRSAAPWPALSEIIESSLRKVGVELDTRPKDEAYPLIQKLPNDIAITSAPGWVKDYPDPFSFIGFLFDGRNIRRSGNLNYSLVGLTPERARELGIGVPRRPIPSVDADIDRCVALTGGDRRSCWAALDKKLMTQVVPWIPYLEASKIIVTSDAVVPYVFDQFSGEVSLAHIGIDRREP